MYSIFSRYIHLDILYFHFAISFTNLQLFQDSGSSQGKCQLEAVNALIYYLLTENKLKVAKRKPKSCGKRIGMDGKRAGSAKRVRKDELGGAWLVYPNNQSIM